MGRKRKAPRKKDVLRQQRLWRLYFKTLAIALAVIAGLVILAYGVFNYLISGMVRTDVNEGELSINTELAEKEAKITNVALFGLDSRNHNYKGLSDATLVLSVNDKTGEIKLTSLARDTYVAVPGYGNTKLTHAYSYGGAELAMQTLNENFKLDISDYVTVNFDSLADVIDTVGGIELEITEGERREINAYLLSGDSLQESGLVHLNGPQAVSYSRIRNIGGDDMRTERQRTVLSCLFEKGLEINPISYPGYIKKFAPMVETSLSNEEMLSLAKVGALGKGRVVLEQAAFPNEYIPHHGETIAKVWYYVYDLDVAADMLHQYVYDGITFEEYGKPADDTALDAPEQ